MTSPPETIHVTCEKCGCQYKDWYRASINLALDDFDEDYLREATTTTCPGCGRVADMTSVIVTEDWEIVVRD